jgi:hypothetical protein
MANAKEIYNYYSDQLQLIMSEYGIDMKVNLCPFLIMFKIVLVKRKGKIFILQHEVNSGTSEKDYLELQKSVFFERFGIHDCKFHRVLLYLIDLYLIK